MKCPNAFRLRRLAPSVVRGLGLRLFLVNSRTKWLLWNVQVHFDCAGSHKVWSAILVCGIFLVSSRAKYMQCPCAFRLRRLAQSVVRSLGLGCLRHFMCKFSPNVALLQRPHAFRLRRLARSVVQGLGLRHFTCKLPHEMALVKCPSAFRLRRLAHSVGRSLGLRHFTCNFCTKWLLCNVHVHVDCAGSHKVWSAVLVCGCLRHFICKFSPNVALLQRPCAFRLHRLAQSVVRSLGMRIFAAFYL